MVDAILRAFGTWSSNHPLINFKDVSEACLLEGLGRNCTHTEVYITAHAPLSKATTSFAAYVTALPARCSVEEVFGAGETPDRCKWERSRGRRTTAGVTVADDYAIAYAHVVFNTEVWAAPPLALAQTSPQSKPYPQPQVCWYLDNTFCVGFHGLIAAGVDVQTLISVIVFSIWGAGFVYLGMLALRAIQDITKEVAQGGSGLRVVARGYLDNLEAIPYLPLVSTSL